MFALKRRLWPVYEPDNRLRLPLRQARQLTRQPYDYSGLVVTPQSGQLMRETTAGVTTNWDVVTPETDNGKRLDRLTEYDNYEVVARKLDPEKAAFLKPIWAVGHKRGTGTKVAHQKLKAAGKQIRGYSKNTLKKYWAAFNKALKVSLEAHPSPNENRGANPLLRVKKGNYPT